MKSAFKNSMRSIGRDSEPGSSTTKATKTLCVSFVQEQDEDLKSLKGT